jgi:hypothetical protein
MKLVAGVRPGKRLHLDDERDIAPVHDTLKVSPLAVEDLNCKTRRVIPDEIVFVQGSL